MPNNNEENVKVSVIVPVYNGEKYVRQCMDSICNQTLREIEIICVDDGSTDSSYEILKEYQEQDERVQIYQQPNLYAGTARNLGKAHATGEYLAFWDCDDYFELSALEDLYEKAASVQADICVCGANRYFDNLGKFEPHVAQYMNKKYIPDGEIFNRNSNEDYILNFTTAVPWNKLFRRRFIENIGLDFQEIRNGNDVYFTINALCQANSITTLDKALITYRTDQEGGLTKTGTAAPLAPINAWLSTAEHLKEADAFPEQSFVNRAISNLIYLLRNLQTFDAFEEAVHYLQDGALEKMSITDDHEADYYYVPWYKDVVDLLYHNKPEELETYLAYYSFSHMMQYSTEKRIANLSLKQSKTDIRDQNKKICALEKQVKSEERKRLKAQDHVIQKKNKINEYKVSIEKKNRKIKKYKNKLESIQNSYSYRIGRGITYFPRKIKQFFH